MEKKSFHKKFFAKNKYGAIKTQVDGITFDSKTEAEYYLILKRSPDHIIIELQPKVYLTRSKILYKPDFLIQSKISEGELYYIDVKGFATPVFNLKKRLWKKYGSGKLLIIKKEKGKFFVKETIETTR